MNEEKLIIGSIAKAILKSESCMFLPQEGTTLLPKEVLLQSSGMTAKLKKQLKEMGIAKVVRIISGQTL